eukprot:9469989-Pyramimonas_sp.AAC.1
MDVVIRPCIGVQVYRHVSVRSVASRDFVVEVTDECDACLSSPFGMSYRLAVAIQHMLWYRQLARTCPRLRAN